MLAGKIGMSDVEAMTLESDPNRIYAKLAIVLVTTIASPPGGSAVFADVFVTDKVAVPDGRKRLTEPFDMLLLLFCPYYPICSTITARL